jgi:hypothetical protein
MDDFGIKWPDDRPERRAAGAYHMPAAEIESLATPLGALKIIERQALLSTGQVEAGI